jgi:hypothetical protein
MLLFWPRMFRGFSSSSLKRHKKYTAFIYFLELRDIYFPVLQTGILFKGDATEIKAAGI